MYRKVWWNPMKYSTHTYHSTTKSKTNYPESNSSWPSTKNPTPYDILGARKGQPYHKRKYYNLVKAYHPDLKGSPHLSRETRIHRFRLIVSAHEILSDSTRRAAYDMYGVGWLSHPTPARRDSMSTYRGPFSRKHHFEERPEGYFDAWEFLSKHKDFLRLLAVILTFGQICLFLVTLSKAEIELNRIDRACQEMILHRQFRSLDAPTLLQLERFLLHRDPSGMGLLPDEMESYRAVSPFCMY
ncbi:unnamed protein product [Penicillium salamii]|nr:unnamed protein product [Penicillium salamii]